MSFKPILRLNHDLMIPEMYSNFVEGLCSNYECVDLIETIPPSLWELNRLCYNPRAVYLIEWLLTQENNLLIKYETWQSLSANPNAIHILEKYYNKIDLESLALNPNGMPLLEKHMPIHGKWVWVELSKNSSSDAIRFLEQHLDKADPRRLSSNPNAVHILEQHLNLVCWKSLAGNPNAIRLIEENLDRVDHLTEREQYVYWGYLSKNPNAIHLLQKHPNKINWAWMASNPAPEALRMVEQRLKETHDIGLKITNHNNNTDDGFWTQLSTNPLAIHLLEKYKDNVDWLVAAKNPNASHLLIDLLRGVQFIGKNSAFFWKMLGQNHRVKQIMYTLDVDAMKLQCRSFAQELLAYTLQPARLLRICDAYGLDLEEYVDLI